MAERVTLEPGHSGPTDAEVAEHNAAMEQVADNGVASVTHRANGEETPTQVHEADPQVDPNNAPEQFVTPRPDDVPEKFWDAEKGEVNVAALLKSQQDAEQALREAQSNDSESAEGNNDAGADDESNDQGNAVAAAEAYYAEHGELNEEQYSKLAEAGITKDMVDNYIAGQEAAVAQLTGAAYGEFEGGEADFKAAQEWARENMTADDIAALDVQLGSDKPSIVAAGAKALAEAFAKNAPVTPGRQVIGGGNRVTDGEYFESARQMKEAMASDEYRTDPAFRQKVAEKMHRSEERGINLFG